MAAVASPSFEVLEMQYQIVDAVMARALQSDAVRTYPLFAWIVMRDLPEYPGAFVARLVTNTPTPYIPGRAYPGRGPRQFAAWPGAF
ncbi:hypothetical protein [Acidisphaera sp. S103]|uniref:hypothetical protein n=1 Tax=Acidisphaera sp. S103 TaxID=1747223 RepID=UPI00131DEAB1|nr:hypothetical protein [Acidisphaera sp. S103]